MFFLLLLFVFSSDGGDLHVCDRHANVSSVGMCRSSYTAVRIFHWHGLFTIVVSQYLFYCFGL